MVSQGFTLVQPSGTKEMMSSQESNWTLTNTDKCSAAKLAQLKDTLRWLKSTTPESTRVVSATLLAAMNGQLQVLRCLAEGHFGELGSAALRGKDTEGRSSAHYAAQANQAAVLRLLWHLAPETLTAVDHHGKAAAHYASHSSAAMEQLIKLVPHTLFIKDNEGETPAHRAVRAGAFDVIECLSRLAPQAALLVPDDAEGALPIHYASQEGHVDMVRLLGAHSGSLSTLDNYGATPAHHACEAGNLNVVCYLQSSDPSLMSRADADGFTPAHGAAQAGHSEVIRHLIQTDPACLKIKESQGKTPAHLAALAGQAGVIHCLGQLMPCTLREPEVNGGTPAHYAAWSNQLPVVRALFEFERETLQKEDDRGDPPLHLIADSETPTAQFLQVCTTWTALMGAVVLRRPSMVAKLLHLGADPTDIVLHGKHEFTALSLAANSHCTSWSLEVCQQTLQLITCSLKWNPYRPQWNTLFPPQFRHGVRHVCGLKVALDLVDRRLPNSLWLMIIAFLPRDWDFQLRTSDVKLGFGMN